VALLLLLHKQDMEDTLPKTDKPRVVIVGAGFAGIYLVKALRKAPVQIVLIDKNNYHRFQPLMYQVASAGLEPGSICSSVRGTFSKYDNFFFRMSRVLEVQPEHGRVLTSDGDLAYDYLVLALGATGNFFGNRILAKNTFTLNNIRGALSIRERLIENLELAIKHNKDTPEEALCIVIVGGGPTGVEMAGAMADLKRYVLPGDYPDFDLDRLEIFLLEGLDRLLPAMSEQAGIRAEKELKEMGVKVRTGATVKNYENNRLVLDNGLVMMTNLVVWSAGVKARSLKGLEDSYHNKGGFEVDVYNKLRHTDNIFCIGDGAHQADDDHPHGLPMLAPVAIQQAKTLGYNIREMIHGRKPRAFRYKDQGMMATIGRNRALAELPSVKIGGRLGWYIWLFVHLFSIMGFRRKFSVLSHWVWNYFTYDKGNRMLLNFKDMC
jgi:NADH dehydrogenase